MTSTPETDANCGEILNANDEFPQEFEVSFDRNYVKADFARNLEIQRNSAYEVLRQILPNWHNEDPGNHNGSIACEITWGDVRAIKKVLGIS